MKVLEGYRMWEKLAPEARVLVREALEKLSPAYDPERGLVGVTWDGKTHWALRESLYYALGLLIRDGAAGAATAERVCREVLALQMIDPDEVWHGCFRHPGDPQPPKMPVPWREVTLRARYQADLAWERITARFGELLADDPRRAETERLLQRALCDTVPVAWDTYEPNAREFVGLPFAMLLEHFSGLLPADLIHAIEKSAHALMEGAIARSESDFTPLNTNIRTILIFLLDWFGARLNEPEWQRMALREAERFLAEYREYHAVAEFNSPTYCGVDLSMLGFWRRYGKQPELRAAADELEAGIWRDMAEFYNPAMRNFSGPYSRAYELEMAIHTCFYDLLYLGLGAERFPWHPFSIESTNNPLLVLGNVHIPADAAERMLTPGPARSVRHSFRELSERGDPAHRNALCTATAWIRPDRMIGALSGSENPSHQLRPLVVFWRCGEALGTLRTGRCLPDGRECHLHTVFFDGEASENRASLRIRNAAQQAVTFYLELQGPGIEDSVLTPERWELPGLTVRVRSDLTLTPSVPAPGTLRLNAPLPADGSERRLELELEEQS